MRDRMLRSSLAAMIAGLWIILVNYGSKYGLHFAKSRWVDGISSLMFGRPVRTLWDWAFTLVIFETLSGVFGYIYARLVHPKPATGNYILRGIGYGLAWWMLLMGSGKAFKVPQLYEVAWETAVTNFVAVVGWGFILGWLMRRWDYAMSKVED